MSLSVMAWLRIVGRKVAPDVSKPLRYRLCTCCARLISGSLSSQGMFQGLQRLACVTQCCRSSQQGQHFLWCCAGQMWPFNAVRDGGRWYLRHGWQPYAQVCKAAPVRKHSPQSLLEWHLGKAAPGMPCISSGLPRRLRLPSGFLPRLGHM